MNLNIALKQLNELQGLANEIRLAADGWDQDWKCLIAILMSARTKDKKTIPVAEELFSKYPSVDLLANAGLEDIEKIVRSVNFYKTKSKNILNLAKIIVSDFNSKIPHEFDKLVELPGVGRKTANVFLAQQGQGTIGVDTHLSYVSQYLDWSKNTKPEKIENDLQKLFPLERWGDLNWIVVRFGQTYTNKKEKDKILEKLKKL